MKSYLNLIIALITSLFTLNGCGLFENNDSILLDTPIVTVDNNIVVDSMNACISIELATEDFAHISSKGICISTSNQNPSTSDLKFVSTSVENTFTICINNLTPNTVYYYRAFAINAEGTTYSEASSFKTELRANTLIDIDGNTYRTVVIGTQTWMAENLKTTHYKDGTAINSKSIYTDDEWYNLTTGAYCFYNNDEANYSKYGALYNFYAVETGKLAPEGWHVPTKAEWETLNTYLGTNAGGQLKSTDPIWTSPNTGATNSTGFNAMPCRGRGNTGNGAFLQNFGYGTIMWSSDEEDVQYAYYGALWYSLNTLTTPFGSKYSGMSVRCIKD